MIKFENRFDEYAYRIAYREIDPSLTSVEEGTWVTINADGKLIAADGTKKAFILIGSRRTGRDTVSGVPVKKLSYLHGVFELSTDKFDVAKTYTEMTPLVVEDGIVRPFVDASDKSYLIEAYALGAPANGLLRICSK